MGLSDFQPLNANSYLCTITLGVVAYLCIRDKKKKSSGGAKKEWDFSGDLRSGK